VKSLFLVLIALMLISCGGGGGREGTCFGSAQVCGDAGATSNSATNSNTSASAFQGISATGSFLVEYVISGTTSEASLLLFENAQDVTEQRLNVKLPFTLSFNRDPSDFLYVSAQNNFSAGTIKVTIKINGVEQRTDQSTAAFGTAVAFMTCCQ
jgi:hypothetical protein